MLPDPNLPPQVITAKDCIYELQKSLYFSKFLSIDGKILFQNEEQNTAHFTAKAGMTW